MAALQLKPLNINMLQSQFYAREQVSPVEVQANAETVQSLIKTLLGDEYSEVVLTNKYTMESRERGFYSLLITDNLIKLKEVCSIKKIEFCLVPDIPEFRLNERVVDTSFMGSFQNKLNKIVSDYANGLVTIIGKR
jgi:hypothetical protein